jgi:predicted nucleotidyltransferase
MSVIHTLFSKARAEVIRLLFADSSKEFHLRELVRLSGMAIRTLQNELSKLEAAELLLSRRDGNRLYFRANTDHPIFPELHGISLKTTGLADRLTEALNGMEGIELAFVFGSFANDKATAQSDIDLIVVGNVGLRALAPRLRELSAELGREINPYAISSKNFASKAKAGDAFIADVISKPKLWIRGGVDELTKLAS